MNFRNLIKLVFVFLLSSNICAAVEAPTYSRLFIAIGGEEEFEGIGENLGAVTGDLAFAIDQEACPILTNSYTLLNYLTARQAWQRELSDSKSNLSCLIQFYKNNLLKDDRLFHTFREDLAKYSIGKIRFTHQLVQDFLAISKNDYNLGFRATIIQTPFSSDNWLLFLVPGTNWLVLVPKKYLEFKNISLPLSRDKDKKLGLKLTRFTKKKLPSSVSIDYSDLIKLLVKIGKSKKSEDIRNLDNVFVVTKPKTEKEFSKYYEPWNIYMVGHGNIGTKICGMWIDDFKKVLKFFNDKVNTNLFYYTSCFSAGANLQEAFSEGFSEGSIFNYTIVVGASVEDTLSLWKDVNILEKVDNKIKIESRNFESFFQGLDEMRLSKAITLENLLLSMTFLKAGGGGNIHGVENIPQIRFPNLPVFQVSKISENVQILTKVIARARELERDPSKRVINVWYRDKRDKGLKGRSVLMIYPQKVSVPLKLIMKKWESEELLRSSGGMHRKWDFSVLKFLAHDNVAEDYNLDTKKYPIIANFIKGSYFSQGGSDPQKVRINSLFDIPFVAYPIFLSMLGGLHYFEEVDLIDIDNGRMYGTGVLTFIRDAFFDLGKVTKRRWAGLGFSNKIFLIRKLKGYNDLLLLLEVIRLKNKSYNLTDLEKALKEKKLDAAESILLKNVVIVHQAITDKVREESYVHPYVVFEVEGIDDCAWMFTFQEDENPDWKFIKMPLRQHREAFENYLKHAKRPLVYSSNAIKKVETSKQQPFYRRVFSYLKNVFVNKFRKVQHA